MVKCRCGQIHAYDTYGQLIRENNKSLDKTYVYEYNGSGRFNIRLGDELYLKIYGLIYKALLSTVTVLLLVLDIFLISLYGFNGQLLIFIYVMIGCVPLCGIVALCTNSFLPSISIDYNSETIVSNSVANELYKQDKHLRNQGDLFYFDEITNCETDGKKMIITLRYGRVKNLYLNFFTKKQIIKIKSEIDKIIK